MPTGAAFRSMTQEVVRMGSHIADMKVMAVGWVTGSILTVLRAANAADFSSWLAPGWFGLTLLLLMTIELLTCFFGSTPAQRAAFSWERHITSKLLLFALVIVSLLLDSLILMSLRLAPFRATGQFPAWAVGFLPITLSTLIWLNTAEAVRSVKNIAQATGDDNIPPVVLWVIRQLRKVDEARLPVGASQNKRLMDNITEEDVRTILHRLDERNALEPPPAPLSAPMNGDADPTAPK